MNYISSNLNLRINQKTFIRFREAPKKKPVLTTPLGTESKACKTL